MRLPFPPTINHYYGRGPGGRHTFLTKRARVFRKQVALALVGEPVFGDERLAILIEAYPPRDTGDIDNILKPLLDALEHAGTFVNDRQVKDLRIVWRHPVMNGAVEVQIWEI